MKAAPLDWAAFFCLLGVLLRLFVSHQYIHQPNPLHLLLNNEKEAKNNDN
jgi:hypothetical protein